MTAVQDNDFETDPIQDLEERLASRLPESADNAASKMDWNERNLQLFGERAQCKQELANIDAQITAAEADPSTTKSARDLDAVRKNLAHQLDDVTTRIINLNYGLIRAYVKKFTSNTSREDSLDFEAAAVVGLMRAIDTYDMGKGRFGQWAYKPIQREVLRAVRDADHPNMNPGDFERRPDILRAKADLIAKSDDGSKQPSFMEIAQKAGATVEQVARVLDAPQLESLSVLVGDDGETELGDLIADTSAIVDETVMAGMSRDALQEFGLPALDVRELYVIIRRYGLDGEEGQRLESIGEQLHLSREAVRQIEAKALAKLRSVLGELIRPGRS
ncbi:sigma-70 family RNA polymerase sigma factor [Streptomyces sp. NPDC087568]|uniref:sigma-70 family RNA polymerase sigma factor n=1 Tax=unclassified Streptomyces TaxID=2593676 RepID=UPI0037FA9041